VQRPPWLEASVPDHVRGHPRYGDLLVIRQASGRAGLLPAGGTWSNTLLRLLERRFWRPAVQGQLPGPCIASGRFKPPGLLVWRALRHPGLVSAQLRKKRSASCRKVLSRPDQARGAAHSRPGFQPAWIHRRDGARCPIPALGPGLCAVPPEAPEP